MSSWYVYTLRPHDASPIAYRAWALLFILYGRVLQEPYSQRISNDKAPRFFCTPFLIVRSDNPQYPFTAMNRKILLFALLLYGLPMMADRLTIEHRYFGADRTEDIVTIGKWVFADDRVQLIDHSGYLLGEEYMENIRRITFTEEAPTPTATDDTESNTLCVYPNPTHNILCIQGVEGNTTLRIYSTVGQLVTTAQGTQISVSDLPAGTYLLQVGMQVIRFVKQ